MLVPPLADLPGRSAVALALVALLSACSGTASGSGAAAGSPPPSSPAAAPPPGAVPTPSLPDSALGPEVGPLPAGFEQAPDWPDVPLRALPVKTGSPLAGTADPAPSDLGPLGRVHWDDLAYPTPCLGGDTAELSGGRASRSGAEVRMRPPVYGDLQRDGSVEALVTLTCATGERRPDRALLYAAGRDGRPRLLGPVVTEDDRLVVDQVEFREGRLRLVGLAYSPAAQLPEPDLAVTRVAAGDGDGVRRVDAFADPITILYEGDEHDETHTETGEEDGHGH